ncbi:MAG TPA: 50S ribosomal protein L4, partial [Cytophagales bacterium]|nr:50S ribosomal protein L4 [Cytophagales bacterium]
APKTKQYLSLLSALSVADKKTLLVLGDNKKNIVLSGRNVPNAKVITANQLNTYDVMNADQLILVESGVELISNILNKQ